MATQTITKHDGEHGCESIGLSTGDTKDVSQNSLLTVQEVGQIVGKSKTKSPRDVAKDLGYAIAKTGKIKQISSKCWIVPSQSGNGAYEVSGDDGKITCTCPQCKFRGFRAGFCKHQWAVKYYLVMQAENNGNTSAQPNNAITDTIECKFCKSTNCIKYGTHGKRRKQVWQCKDCDRTFIPDDAFRRMQYDPKVISLSLSMHFRQMSLRSIADTLEESYGLKISHQTVYNWIAKYAELLRKYIESLTPHFSGQVNADELYVFIRDDLRYWFISIDPDTRYILASSIAERKDIDGAVKLFEKTRLTIRDQMLIKVVTDGLAAYRKGFKRVFYSKDHLYREHESAIRLNGDVNNNIMERVNNTVRDREKCFRRLKSMDSPIFKLYPIFYNHVRKHQALNGLTPAEASGISLGLGKDKWLGLIKRAQEVKEEGQEPSTETKQKDWGIMDSYTDSPVVNDEQSDILEARDEIALVINIESKDGKRSRLLQSWKNKGWL
jgi:transposase-like protein